MPLVELRLMEQWQIGDFCSFEKFLKNGGILIRVHLRRQVIGDLLLVLVENLGDRGSEGVALQHCLAQVDVLVTTHLPKDRCEERGHISNIEASEPARAEGDMLVEGVRLGLQLLHGALAPVQ